MLEMIPQESASDKAFKETWVYKAGLDPEELMKLNAKAEVPKFQKMYGKYWKQMYAAKAQQLAQQALKEEMAKKQQMGLGGDGQPRGILNSINPYLFPEDQMQGLLNCGGFKC
jgi:hypothetical protein